MELSSYRKRLDRLLGQRHAASKVVREQEAALSVARQNLQDAQIAQKVIQEAAQFTQEHAHAQIARVVSRCLEAVFEDEPYEFKIKFEQKRGKTEATLCFLRDGLELEDPTDQASGAAIDVAAFGLRLACLMLARPRRRRFLCLDEPFKHIHKSKADAVRGMLMTLAQEMAVQIVLVTHQGGLRCGKVVEIE